MKRDFLKNLGIEDKDIIDKIIDENSADIGKAKGEFDILKSKVSTLETELSTKETEIINLKNKAGEIDSLTQKITTLETENQTLTTKLNTEVSKLQKTHAIENSIRDAKAKNVKSVMALLDLDKIKYENNELSGVSELVESLKSDESTSFLFGESNSSPSGTNLNNPPSGGNGGNPQTSKTLAEAIAKAIAT